jgi:hypothetical protein
MHYTVTFHSETIFQTVLPQAMFLFIIILLLFSIFLSPVCLNLTPPSPDMLYICICVYVCIYDYISIFSSWRVPQLTWFLANTAISEPGRNTEHQTTGAAITYQSRSSIFDFFGKFRKGVFLLHRNRPYVRF